MVSVSSAHSLAISKSKLFVLYNFISIFVFGLIYYFLQYVDVQPFVSNKETQYKETQHKDTHSPTHFSLMSCLHFSLFIQATIGYDGMTPISRSCIFINSIQLLLIFWITATTISD